MLLGERNGGGKGHRTLQAVLYKQGAHFCECFNAKMGILVTEILKKYLI